MTGSAVGSSTLTVETEGFSGQRFRFVDPDGREVATMEKSVWKEAATASVGGRSFAFTRTRDPGRPWLLTAEADGRELVRALKPSAWCSRFELHLGGETLDLRPRGVLSQRFELWRGDEQIGEVVPKGWTSRKAHLVAPPDWPMPLVVFVFFLVRLIWTRNQAAVMS